MAFPDPALGLLWACALSCIWYGASRSYRFLKEGPSTVTQEVKFVQSNRIIFMPIIGSIVLILLFLFLDSSITIWIMVVLISLVVLSSQFFVFSPLADYIFDDLFPRIPKGFKVPKIGFIPVSGLVLFAYCAGVVALWLCTGHWFVVDACAWCIGIAQMCILRLPSLKIATLLLVPFLIYDVFWVFISPLFFNGTSVMVDVAMKMPPFPLMLKIPRITGEPGDYSGLGLGDIVLPGLFIVFLYGFDKHLKKPDRLDFKNWENFYLGYFSLALIEYTAGYINTIIVGSLMESGQPALLYLVPWTLGGTIFFAWKRGDLALMWAGTHPSSSQPTDVEAQGLLHDQEEEEGKTDKGEELLPKMDPSRSDSSLV